MRKRGEKKFSRNNAGTLYKNYNNILWVLKHVDVKHDNNTGKGRGKMKVYCYTVSPHLTLSTGSYKF